MSEPALQGPVCAAFGCAAVLGGAGQWCGRHWRMIPSALRRRLADDRLTGPELARAIAEAKRAVETAEFGARLL